MSNLTVKIEGADKIIKAFQASPRLFVPIFDKAIKKSIIHLLGTSRMVTPIDKGFLSGAGMETDFETLTGKISNSAPYHVFVHEGTSKMEARPFFQWGMEAGQEQVQNIFDKALAEFTNAL